MSARSSRVDSATDVPLADGGEVRRHLRALLAGRGHEVAIAAALVVVRALATFAPPVVVGRVVDTLAGGAAPTRLFSLLAFLAGAVLAGAVADRGRIVRVATLGEQVLADLRTELHAALLRWRSVEVEARMGRLLSVVTSDVAALSQAVRSALPEAVEVVVLLAVAAAVLPALSLPLAGVVVVCLLPVVFVGRWFAPRSTRTYAELRAAQADVVDSLQESLAALDTTRALGVTALRDADLDAHHDVLLTREHRAMRLRNVLLPSVSLARGVATAAVLGVGGLLALDGRLPVGDVVAFALALRVVFHPVARLSVLANVVLRSQAALARVVGVVTATQPRLAEPMHPVPVPAGGELRLEGVSHAYPTGGDVLHDVDLVVSAGETLALVGPSGAGKTTLLRLLARIDDPRRGRVVFGGVDLRHLDPQALRRRLVLVTQDGVLPGATVAEVVAGDRPPEERAEVCEHAMRTVGLDLALDTGVEELDDARRQQLVLARVVAIDPAVVLLDEATSALDPDDASAVDMALRRALADRTLIVIAHRPRTALSCDRLAVVRDGRIVDVGPPDEVIARDSWLAAFAAVTVAS